MHKKHVARALRFFVFGLCKNEGTLLLFFFFTFFVFVLFFFNGNYGLVLMVNTKSAASLVL